MSPPRVCVDESSAPTDAEQEDTGDEGAYPILINLATDYLGGPGLGLVENRLQLDVIAKTSWSDAVGALELPPLHPLRQTELCPKSQRNRAL